VSGFTISMALHKTDGSRFTKNITEKPEICNPEKPKQLIQRIVVQLKLNACEKPNFRTLSE